MVDNIRAIFYKIFVAITIFFLCQLLYEISQELDEHEDQRFKRSIEDKEIVLDIPGNTDNDDHFIRNKRINSNITKKFIPTYEWQEIFPGQAVPSGLHYRVNLETGKKEAKLLDKNNKSKELLEVANNKPDESSYLNYDVYQKDHQKAIEKLQKEFDRFKFDEKYTELNKDKDLKNWRSIDQIKKEFNDLSIKMTTDSENVKELLERYKKSNDNDEKVVILKDLEYILHQYDVASDFVKMRGLEILKADFLNNENSEMQKLISTILGSASSSNPPFKVSLVKSGLFDKLIHKLDKQKDLKLNLKTVYAISSTVRLFPHAQKQLIEQNGLKIFKKFFESYPNGQNTTDQIKIQIKIISLLSDLIDEYKFTSEELANLRKSNSTVPNELKNLEQKMNQYEQVNLEKSFLNEGFCLILPKNLNNSSYDVKEKILKSMYSFKLTCKNTFKKDYLDNLIVIKQELISKVEKDKLNGESDHEYFQNLIQLTQNLIDYLNS